VVGIGEFVVASAGRPLPCPGQDLDQGGVPLDRLFHRERLAQERLAFAEPTLVGDHRFVRSHVRSKFLSGECHCRTLLVGDICANQMS